MTNNFIFLFTTIMIFILQSSSMNIALLIVLVEVVTVFSVSLARGDLYDVSSEGNKHNLVNNSKSSCFPQSKSWNMLVDMNIIWGNEQSSCNIVYVLRCYCLTSTTTTLRVGTCLYGCFYTDRAIEYNQVNITTLSLTDGICSSFDRNGTLCGRCRGGYGPPAYSFSLKCVPCGNQTLWTTVPLYILVAYGPLTVFLGLIVLFTISVNTAALRGWILVCQLSSFDFLMRILVTTGDVHPESGLFPYVQIFGTVYGVWNLDFFRSVYKPFCLHPSLTTLQVMSLDYIIAAYPLVLIVVMYAIVDLYSCNYWPMVIVGKLFHHCCIRFRRQLDIRTSLIDAFGTFFSLSYIKFLTTTINLLIATRVWNNENNEVSYRMYFDGTMELFGKRHIPFAVVGILFGVCCNIIPLVLMLVYSFPRSLAVIPASVHSLLYPFMDNILACYKDGTNGTRNCRYFGVVYHITVLAYIGCILWAKSVLYITVNAYVCIVTGMLVAVIQPYKSKVYNIVDVILILSVGLCYTGTMSSFIAFIESPFEKPEGIVMALLPMVIPLFYILGFLGYKSFAKFRYIQQHFTRRMTFRYWNPLRMMNASGNSTSEESLIEQ